MNRPPPHAEEGVRLRGGQAREHAPGGEHRQGFEADGRKGRCVQQVLPQVVERGIPAVALRRAAQRQQPLRLRVAPAAVVQGALPAHQRRHVPVGGQAALAVVQVEIAVLQPREERVPRHGVHRHRQPLVGQGERDLLGGSDLEAVLLVHQQRQRPGLFVFAGLAQRLVQGAGVGGGAVSRLQRGVIAAVSGGAF